jgi:hypothetical protein
MILVFGEDHNDAQSVAAFVKLVLGEGAKIKPMRRPLVLANRDSAKFKATKNADHIAQAVGLAQMKGSVTCAVIHRDADRIEPGEDGERKSITETYSGTLDCSVIAAVPAWEMEAWLMLFPDALAAYRPCWKRLSLKGRRPGAIRDAKEALIRMLRSGDRKCRDYKELDAPGVAEKVLSLKVDLEAAVANSTSFGKFANDLRSVEQ